MKDVYCMVNDDDYKKSFPLFYCFNNNNKLIKTANENNEEKLARNILLTVKSLKKLIDNKCHKKINSSEIKVSENIRNSYNNIKYKEEWKQAALILDRLFFYLFAIMMPVTITVFFKTNFIEYIISSSNTKRYDNVPNINGC